MAIPPVPPPPPPAPPPPPGPPGPRPPGLGGPPSPDGHYPQQAYYAPGWTAPAGSAPRRRRNVALVLLVGLTGTVVLGVAGWALAYWMQTREIGQITSPTTVSARQVQPGHCIAELPPDGRVSRVRLVPCSEEHEAEVVGLLPLPPGDWPGHSAVATQVGRWCEMDSAQVAAGFTAVVWAPSETSWAQGDTTGVCVAWLEGGTVTGSWVEGDVEPG